MPEVETGRYPQEEMQGDSDVSTPVEEVREGEPSPGDVVDPIDEKIFSQNLFFEGGETYEPRLDELNAARERQLKGEYVMIGDASARDLVEQVFKRAGMLGNRLVPRLVEVFAEALLKEVGDSPTEYMNPLHRRAGRPSMFNRVGVEVTDAPEARGPGHVDGYPKPTAEEAAETERKQREVTELEARVQREREAAASEQEPSESDVDRLIREAKGQ